MRKCSAVGKTLISRKAIQKRVKEIAAGISRDYKGKTPVFVGVLRGCVLFFADLLKNVDLDCSIEFMAVSSYQGTESSGKIRVLMDLKDPIADKDVIIVEDIVDTGITADFLLKNLKLKKPKSLALCALLDKPEARVKKVKIDYKGFTIPSNFVVGYGLDCDGLYRNLPYVGILKQQD